MSGEERQKKKDGDEVGLPEKLVTLRKQAGLTQLELAEKLDVSRQAISKWELGTAVPSTDNLKMLSKLYGVSIDALLGVEDAMDELDVSISDRVVIRPMLANC